MGWVGKVHQDHPVPPSTHCHHAHSYNHRCTETRKHLEDPQVQLQLIPPCPLPMSFSATSTRCALAKLHDIEFFQPQVTPGRSGLDLRKKFLVERVVRGCPGQWWRPHPWRVQRTYGCGTGGQGLVMGLHFTWKHRLLPGFTAISTDLQKETEIHGNPSLHL